MQRCSCEQVCPQELKGASARPTLDGEPMEDRVIDTDELLSIRAAELYYEENKT